MKLDYTDIMNHMNDGLYVVDNQRRIVFWNRAAERISGYRADEVIGRQCSDNILVHVNDCGETLCTGRCPMVRCMSNNDSVEAEVFLHHRDGHRLPVWVRIAPVHDKNGQVVGATELFTDISERTVSMLQRSELESLAMIDPLTEISNRRHLTAELENRITEKHRHGISFGCIFMDIDHFKLFNDTWGHQAGDTLLKVIAATLSASTRGYDMVGRWGGEEFMAIVRNITPQTLEKVALRYQTMVRNSYILEGEERLSATISIGAAMAADEDDAETVVKRADQLMYQSKAAGRDRITCG